MNHSHTTINPTFTMPSNLQSISLFKPNVIQFESLDILFKNMISHLSERVLEISGDYGTVRLALSGQSGLLDVYKLMSQNYIFPFDQTELFQLEDDINNTFKKKMINCLGDQLELVSYANWIKPKSNLELTANNYAQDLSIFDEDESFDICLVEIDNQGNIAGLVANGKGLDITESEVVCNKSKKFNKLLGDWQVQSLVSVSMGMILQSKEIVCIMKDETEAMDELLSGNKTELQFPAKALLNHSNVTIFYYLDI